MPHAPVALVLGAQVKPDGTPSGFLAARLDLAKRLYDAGRIQTIIVSGNHRARVQRAGCDAELLDQGGCAGDKVILILGASTPTNRACEPGRSTISQLIMVTQSYHLARAVATCRALGIDAIGVGDDSARQYRVSWWRGTIRDQVACVKTIVDLAPLDAHPMPLATEPGAIHDATTTLRSLLAEGMQRVSRDSFG